MSHALHSTISWGIIGCGRQSLRVMQPAINEAQGCRLSAFGSENQDKVKMLRSQTTIKVCDSYNDLLNDPNIDAVYIGLPNHLHAPWSIRALESNKHVLCDKPMGVTLDEVIKVQQKAKELGLYAVEAFMYRFHPQHQLVDKLLSADAIGEIRLLTGHFHYQLERQNDIRLRPECGGGALLDVGCYLADLSRLLLKQMPQKISANMIINSSGVNEFTSFQLDYPTATAQFSCSCNLPRLNSYTLLGTGGSITLPDAFHVPRGKKTVIELHQTGCNRKILHSAPANQFVLEIEAFNDLIRGKNHLTASFGDGVENLAILDAVRKASSGGY